MEIREEHRDRNLVADVIGRLDVIASPELEARLMAMIDSGIRILVLNVTQLEFISSAGLRVLIVAAKKIRAQGGDMVFAGADQNIKKILDISGFTKMFKIVETVDEAFSAS
ncbi:MAG: STAS domain-containing protein [Planctomycetes bacterium]|nr:STAS domain-containing protein [Planctomycetota bacterium]